MKKLYDVTQKFTRGMFFVAEGTKIVISPANRGSDFANGKFRKSILKVLPLALPVRVLMMLV
ncbi:hypothetical protein JQV19_10165 [Sulfitobacter mediterraneus]|uniref:hypothetical protein n=1 Tax=Sulfitobacter mediterraneus TaxID=83219 RepID=UPI00193AA229|nr:hypothetical protein [Sulfitobacter mediterraneus]MBM1557012.1 hypothetical protein [Sulfitobacter mediterraneus]MBM1569197.1 hypothetical protein [Sulfitobacter mediterraneus]MBM1572624.1 hypothetical protein [Sulfitobacter mediterraneus]MBM1576787.1 hypothetical protein [Sulfitobacter mediterraneus]MBM1579970.1 hypothetical protein [Sulfitobacter mediterraneus]